jgi:tetratricopeptide (TPR) repeat protein
MFGQMGIVILTMLAIVLLHFNFSAFARMAKARSNKTGQAGLMSGPELLFNDGRTAYWNRSYRDAVRMLRHAAMIRPERAITHYYLGLSYSALGSFAEAEKSYRAALRREPKNNIAWCELGDLYRKLSRWEDAVEAYQQALQIKPDFVTAHSGLEAAYACLAIRKAA